MFAASYSFQHVTSSPHFPRANGFVERMVQTVKSIFTKCKETRSDPHLAMLCYRTTPLDHNIVPPSELLNHRGYKSNLPQTRNIRQTHSNSDNATLLQHRQVTQKIFHDRSGGPGPLKYYPHSHHNKQCASKTCHQGVDTCLCRVASEISKIIRGDNRYRFIPT